MKIKRLWCLIDGCQCSHDLPGCVRCGAALYEDAFVRRGLRVMYWLRRWKSDAVAFIKGNKCDVCGRRFRPRDRIHTACCSDKCYSEWIPF